MCNTAAAGRSVVYERASCLQADAYFEILHQQEIAWWTMSYGAHMKTPPAWIQGPRAMLIDETAGSAATCCPGCSVAGERVERNSCGPLSSGIRWAEKLAQTRIPSMTSPLEAVAHLTDHAWRTKFRPYRF